MKNLRLTGDENYISAEDIHKRVQELGAYFTDKFGTSEVVTITMMNGAKVFATDLIRSIKNINLLDDNMRVSSYSDTAPSGNVSFHYDISVDIKNRHVLLIEDILDTGTTLSKVIPELKERNPRSISVVCMFEKPEKRLPGTEFVVDDLQIGMKIADKFILGYGLDWKDPGGLSRYRNLPYITVAEFITKNDANWIVPKLLPDDVL